MRTTLDIEEDVVLAAKEIARRRGVSLGRVLSDLARQALTQGQATVERAGVPLFPVTPNSAAVTPELVRRLRDEVP